MTSNTQTLSSGQTIGGSYRIDQVLARGGFGVVWAAQHLRTGQQLAIKVLDADRAAMRPGSVQRFLREAQITASLRHPNTVRVFDVGGTGEPADPFYLVMERLYGPTLEEVLHSLHKRQLTMSEATALDIAIPMLGSLAEAHTAGLVHRDLKPGNVMLNEVPGDRPVVKVLDFGCTYVRGSQLTQDGNVFGTPGYMSPEQIVGDPIDARTDLYALGLVIYRCITGRAPFIAEETIALLYQYTTRDVPDPQKYASRELSRPMVDALLRSLARKRDDRYADAGQMRDALQSVHDAVRAVARRTRGGRDTMLEGRSGRNSDGLSALARLVREDCATTPWHRQRTESDIQDRNGGQTALLAGEILPQRTRTEAMAQLDIGALEGEAPESARPQAPSAVTPPGGVPVEARVDAAAPAPAPPGPELQAPAAAEELPEVIAVAPEHSATSTALSNEGTAPPAPADALDTPPSEDNTAPRRPMQLWLAAALVAVVATVGWWATSQPSAGPVPVAAAGGLAGTTKVAAPAPTAPARQPVAAPSAPAHPPTARPKVAASAEPTGATTTRAAPRAVQRDEPASEEAGLPAAVRRVAETAAAPAPKPARKRKPRSPTRRAATPRPAAPPVLKPKLLDD